MAFERVWENNSRSLRPKAKSTNYMPARTSKKVEILSQPIRRGKNFLGQSMLNSRLSSRFRQSQLDVILISSFYYNLLYFISSYVDIVVTLVFNS